MPTGNVLKDIPLMKENFFPPPPPPEGCHLVQDTYARAPGTNIEAERRMVLPKAFCDHADGPMQAPQIYLTRTSKDVIQGNLSNFIGEPVTRQTLDRVTQVVERMVMAAGSSLPAFRGRGLRTVAPNSTSLIMPAYENLDERTDENGSISLVKARNLVPPPLTKDMGVSSFVKGYEWDPNTGHLRVELQTEAYEVMKSIEESPFSPDVEIATEEQWQAYRKKAAFKQKMHCNLVIKSKTRGSFVNGISPEELTAIETLRELITEKEFRRYLKYGFILVEGKSGDLYQIFRDSWHIKVLRQGVLVEEICINLDGTFKAPPTDKCIAFMAMLQTSESEFRKLGNVYPMLKKVA